VYLLGCLKRRGFRVVYVGERLSWGWMKVWGSAGGQLVVIGAVEVAEKNGQQLPYSTNYASM